MRSTLILALAALPFINALTVSKSGQCGASNSLTCKGSTFGSCCSQHNYCGSTSAYCGTGCQSGYGTCTSTTPVTPATVSTDGTCGGTKGYTCLKSVYGNCCSRYGFCGSTSAYCGTGCNSGFGSCTGTAASSSVRTSSSTRSSTRSSSTSTRTSTQSSTHTTSSAASTSTLKVTTNARCGVGFTQFTCQGSKWGNCCSQYSYCGSTDAYCGKGCQTGFGTCKPSTSSSSVVSLTTSSSSSSSSTSSTAISSSSSSTTVSSSSSSSSSTSEAPSSTSSSVVSSTTVASSSSACAPAPTNAVQNPSFETGSLASWVETTTGFWDSLTISTGAHTGTYDYYGYTYSNAQATITLLQENVLIPSGTLVDCTAYGFGNRNTGETTTFILMIDGQQCGTNLVITSSGWTQFGGQATVVGDSHSVSIEVVSSGSDDAGMNFGVDDIFVVPAVAAGATTCPTSSSGSSSAALSTTSSSPSSSSESSTVVSTTSSDVTSSTSSLVVSTTTSAAQSSSSCVPASQTNAVSNPSFETGDIPPWVESQTGGWSDIRVVGGRPHSGTFYFFGATDSPAAATITLTQTDIIVADGTVVDCYMWVNAYRNSGYTTTYTLSLDGVECGGVTVVSTDYTRVGGQVEVSGNLHVVTIVIASSGADEASALVGVDDISVIPVSGPGFIDTCAVASSSPTAPAPPGETI